MNDDAIAAAALDKSYRPADAESRQYARWEQAGAFSSGRTTSRPFTIVIPPPNVTGSLHMGHALNNTLQDVLVRWRRMQGRDVLWQPGTDHAGIATQMVVERQLGAEGVGLARRGMVAGQNQRLIGRDEFVERVWKWKAESGGTITGQLRRLGASLDWRRERFTMDEGLSAAVRKVFVDLYKQGLIYRDKRLGNWDPVLHTAISDLEAEAREVRGHLWHIRYPIDGEAGAFIAIATTRPETMLGDTAIAVHPEDERYQALVGKHAVLPLVGRKIPIVADEYSDPTKGTGAVKITPAHDFNDFEVGKRHGLATINILTADARLNDSVPEAYRGLDRFVARKRIVADLEAQGLLVKVEDHTHVVPHGDRSGAVLEPWLTDQWYCDAKTLAKPAIEAVEQGHVVFMPKQWEKTYFEWMRNIQPWAISRQLWWGHQVPVWYGPDGKIFVELDEVAAKAAAHAHYGKDVALERDSDVLDTWFSSALWPFSTLGWPEQTSELARYYPTDVLVTGFDIIFFWVARMMMMGLHFMAGGKADPAKVPFRTVYVHALVRDAKGQKMSKSKGNVIDPLQLIDKYGCDALRFTLTALAVPGRDVKLAEPRVEGYRNFATKLWNAARYCQMNGCRAQDGFDMAGARLTVNRWIVGELARTVAAVDEALETFRFHDAAGALYQFVWGTFCDWYLEFSKPILTGSDEAAKAETRAVTGAVLRDMLKLLHPIMPFITEELWEKLDMAPGQLLMLASWPSAAPIDEAAADEMNWVVTANTEIRSACSVVGVPANARPNVFYANTSAVAEARIHEHEEQIRRLARIGAIQPLYGAIPVGALPVAVPESTLIVVVGDVIDAAAERARLGREIEKLAKEIAGIDRRLTNADFLAKADPEVVEDTRERRAELDAARARLDNALQRIAGL